MISVRQTRDLPRASFRFRIATDTLAFSYVLTANGSHSGLSPVRVRPCWANKKKHPPASARECYVRIVLIPVE